MLRRRSPQGSPLASQACAASATLSGPIRVRRLQKRAAHESRGRLVAPTAAPDCDDPKRSRRLLAVGLVTPAAILAHLGDLDLEAVEVLGRGPGRLGLAGKLGEPGGEIGLVLPNRGQCRGIATGLGIVREEYRRLLACLGEGREHLFRCVEIEGLLGLQHVGGNLALVAIGLHQRLASSDRVALRHQRGGPEREHCNNKRGADHLVLPLWIDLRAGGAGWWASRKQPGPFFYSRWRKAQFPRASGGFEIPPCLQRVRIRTSNPTPPTSKPARPRAADARAFEP